MKNRKQNIKLGMRKENFSSVPCSRLRVPRSRGFALMFAVLASSVLLSISVAIWNIALREVRLSSFGRESQIAFYSADSAAECAMYWDMKGAFATSTDSILSISSITCDGVQDIIPVIDSGNIFDNKNATTKFSIVSGSCSDIVVTKLDPDGDGQSKTRVESFGHNSCDVSSPTLVERGFRINY